MDNEFLSLTFPSRLTGTLAITHVTVIPMDSEQLLPDHTLIIEGGVIQALGPSTEVATGDAQVVDGSGNYVMPGLCDMYCGYSDPADSIMYLANGITLIRTSGGSPPQLAIEQMVERGELPGPRLITTTPTIDGVGPTGRTDLPGGVPMTKPDQAEGLVQGYAERSYHQIRVYALLTKKNLVALGQASAAAGLRLVGKCPDRVTFEEAIEAGQTCIDQMHTVARGHLQSGFEEPEHWDRFGVDVLNLTAHHLDFGSIRTLAQQLATSQTWNTPTLVWHDHISREPSENMANPMLKYMPRSAIPAWEAAFGRFAARSGSDIAVWRQAKQAQARTLPQVVAILHEEGAPLMTGTDSPGPFTIHGFALIEELEKFVEIGFRPYEALRCSTIEPARFLDQGDRWGTIAVGKRADLIMTRVNPLEDIGALREIEAVFVNGYYLTRGDLDMLLEQRIAALAAPPELPRTALSPTNGEGQVVNEGIWLERIGGEEAGRVAYRHCLLPSGNWLIEEQYSGTPRRFLERFTTRLTLTPDFQVWKGEYRIESCVGEETCQISRSDTGYRVITKEVDGYESVSNCAGGKLFPDDKLVLSVVPLMLSQQSDPAPEMLIPTLSINAGATSAVETQLSRVEKESTSDTEIHWHVKVDRPTESTEQTYRLSIDGRFLGMEGISFRGRRELVTLDASD